MKNIIIYILVLILLVIGGIFAFEYYKPAILGDDNPQNQVLCTMEAKMCPDGSYVGRGGPKCDFADCPMAINTVASTTSTSTSSTTTVKIINVSGSVAKIGESVIVNGISITPISIIEESRCPTDVKCIQAGRIIIKAKLANASSSKEVSLELGKSFSFENKIVTLNDAIPKPNTKVTLKANDYSFSFSVTDKSIERGKGQLKGNVSIGPVCPVESIDSPCTPTPEMYSAVKIYVYMRDKKTLITTITPDSTGNFSIALAKGTYYVDMTHPPIGGITGVPKTVDILEGKTVTLLIKVDTGIR